MRLYAFVVAALAFLSLGSMDTLGIDLSNTEIDYVGGFNAPDLVESHVAAGVFTPLSEVAL